MLSQEGWESLILLLSRITEKFEEWLDSLLQEVLSQDSKIKE